MEAIDTKTIGKYRIDIIPDTYPESPREWDNLGTMVLFPNHLGDEHDYKFNDYESWEEMGFDIAKQENAGVILPLFIYEHSGMTIATTPFHCPWDSGQRGFIFISKEKMREEYSYKRVSKKLKERVKGYLEAEVKTLAQYHEGDVYGYRITDIEKDEEVDSCWGYYGSDECMGQAESITTYMLAKVDYEDTLEKLDD